MKYAEVYIPKWAMKALLIWAERAYRRGFQHGLVAGERQNLVSDTDGYKFRYECAGKLYPTDAREPLHKMKPSTLKERHLKWDEIPFVETQVDPGGMMLIRRDKQHD
jgi:hypothetical protein